MDASAGRHRSSAPVTAAPKLLHTEVLAWVSVPSDVSGIVLRRLTGACAAGGDVGNGVTSATHEEKSVATLDWTTIPSLVRSA